MRRNVIAALQKHLEDLHPTLGISGMALGVDQWAAQLCTDLEIPWDAYVPFKGQESEWPRESQATYRTLLGHARRIHVTATSYSNAAFQHRNMAMVNACDLLLAVWDGSSGGTGNCVAYAQKVGRKMVRIDPRTL